jgi:hypothetical protein
MTKQGLVDAVVDVISDRSDCAVLGEPTRGYVETYEIVSRLVVAGIFPDEIGDARRSLQGKVQRAINEELQADNPRIVRLSSKVLDRYPTLKGEQASFYGNTSLYCTPEMFKAAQEAVAIAIAARRQAEKELDNLIVIAESRGLPAPIEVDRRKQVVSYDLEAMAKILDLVGA